MDGEENLKKGNKKLKSANLISANLCRFYRVKVSKFINLRFLRLSQELNKMGFNFVKIHSKRIR